MKKSFVPVLLLAGVLAGSVAWAANPVGNPGFEEGYVAWGFANSYIQQYNGTSEVDVPRGANYTSTPWVSWFFSQDVDRWATTIAPNTKYTAKCWVAQNKAQPAFNGGTLVLSTYWGITELARADVPVPAAPGQWAEASVSWISPSILPDYLKGGDNAIRIAAIGGTLANPSSTIWDDFSLEIAPLSASLSAFVVCADYGQSSADILVKVDLMTPGTSDIVKTYRTALDPYGKFSIADLPIGTFDVAIKANCWLKKVFTGVNFGDGVTELSTLNQPITLAAGDLDGDNEVTSTDLSILGLNLGTQGD